MSQYRSCSGNAARLPEGQGRGGEGGRSDYKCGRRGGQRRQAGPSAYARVLGPHPAAESSGTVKCLHEELHFHSRRLVIKSRLMEAGGRRQAARCWAQCGPTRTEWAPACRSPREAPSGTRSFIHSFIRTWSVSNCGFRRTQPAPSPTPSQVGTEDNQQRTPCGSPGPGGGAPVPVSTGP